MIPNVARFVRQDSGYRCATWCVQPSCTGECAITVQAGEVSAEVVLRRGDASPTVTLRLGDDHLVIPEHVLDDVATLLGRVRCGVPDPLLRKQP